jgi:hypothetical protein
MARAGTRATPCANLRFGQQNQLNVATQERVIARKLCNTGGDLPLQLDPEHMPVQRVQTVARRISARDFRAKATARERMMRARRGVRFLRSCVRLPFWHQPLKR